MELRIDGRLVRLFSEYAGHAPEFAEALSSSGGDRKYFRLGDGVLSVVGAVGTDRNENRAFISIGRHFRSKGLNVPQIYGVSDDGMCYIQEDLGQTSLFDAVSPGRQTGQYGAQERELLCRTVGMLPALQFEGAEGLDFEACCPEPEFNASMVMADLNYFRFCFLKTAVPDFNQALLERDFAALCGQLLQFSGNTFMYRDFQARNVMLKDGVPYFIDFQGGRRGPVYYDVASFIWQARARYPDGLKEQLTDAYLASLKNYTDESPERFRRSLRLFVLLRTMQVLGAYGFRGYFERKPHFLESIPYAVDNLRHLVAEPFEGCPYLTQLLGRIAEMPRFALAGADAHSAAGSAAGPQTPGRLAVTVCSFSYRKGIPQDGSGNGGGYVFDCRAIENPGKYPQYRNSTGMDSDVKAFLEAREDTAAFLGEVYALVDRHVERFISRGFTHLMVSFGCTGGQHRSVYCAQALAGHLAARYDVDVELIHREQNVRRTIRGQINE